MFSHGGPSCEIFLTDGEVVWVGSEEGEIFGVIVVTLLPSRSPEAITQSPDKESEDRAMQFSDACFPMIL